MTIKADIVVGLQYGDCGKGKVTNHLLLMGDYTHCLRYSGAHNCGHTIYLDGQKFVTHILPAGCFHGVTSIIGSGCCLNVNKFFDELNKAVIAFPMRNVENFIKIAYNTHIITEEHLKEDGEDTVIGTTRTGSGPAFRDKHARTGKRAEDIPALKSFLCDPYKEFHSDKDVNILCEGAQGFGLDIDHGDYPMVTSSNCIAPAALMNGIPWHAINKVYGVAKAYNTYVGAKKFQPHGKIYDVIGDLGNEFGATTGRRRQVDWMDLPQLVKAVRINGVTDLIVNKMDILNKVGEWKLKMGGYLFSCNSEESFKKNIIDAMPKRKTWFGLTRPMVRVIFSYDAKRI